MCAAILKQATVALAARSALVGRAARRGGPERNPADCPGIKEIILGARNFSG